MNSRFVLFLIINSPIFKFRSGASYLDLAWEKEDEKKWFAHVHPTHHLLNVKPLGQIYVNICFLSVSSGILVSILNMSINPSTNSYQFFFLVNNYPYFHYLCKKGKPNITGSGEICHMSRDFKHPLLTLKNAKFRCKPPL